MEQAFESLCGFLSELGKIDQNLSSYRLSYAEVAAMMEFVDTKRKGFLDLNDIFELAGKVTENELFDIFKFLDARKSGEIREEDLQLAIGDSQLTSNNKSKEHIFPRFYAVIDTVKDKPKSIAQLKKKYALLPAALKSLYQYISDLTQSKYLSLDDLLPVLKAQFIRNKIKWSKVCEQVIRQLFPVRNISESKFIEAFTSEPKGVCFPADEENLLKGIEEMSTSSIKSQSICNKLKMSGISSENAPSNKKPAKMERKSNNLVDAVLEDTTPFFKAERCDSENRILTQNRQALPAKGRGYELLQNNIDSVLQNIKARREKLRQDSVERKKIIEDVMQRKKQLFGVNNTVSNSQTPEWMHERELSKNEASGIKKTNKSYLNHNPTFWPTQIDSRAANALHADGLERSYERTKYCTKTDNYEQPLFSFERGVSNAQNIDEAISSPHQLRRPQTPKANPDISQILKKYTGLNAEGLDRGEPQVTLKALVKSKSGLIREPSSNLNHRESTAFRQKQQGYQSYGLSRDYLHNSSTGVIRESYKENVMKRAEEEAARKIEQIERKARMKVLEKKRGSRHREDLEWGRFSKQALHY